jgi:hypothetical protein
MESGIEDELLVVFVLVLLLDKLEEVEKELNKEASDCFDVEDKVLLLLIY